MEKQLNWAERAAGVLAWVSMLSAAFLAGYLGGLFAFALYREW